MIYRLPRSRLRASESAFTPIHRFPSCCSFGPSRSYSRMQTIKSLVQVGIYSSSLIKIPRNRDPLFSRQIAPAEDDTPVGALLLPKDPGIIRHRLVVQRGHWPYRPSSPAIRTIKVNREFGTPSNQDRACIPERWPASHRGKLALRCPKRDAPRYKHQYTEVTSTGTLSSGSDYFFGLSRSSHRSHPWHVHWEHKEACKPMMPSV